MSTTATVLAACLMLASETYRVPPAVMVGIMQVEGGRVGQQVGPNVNGTYDLGPMQINTMWLPSLARHWKVDVAKAHTWVRDNGCVNMHVAAWIVRTQMDNGHGLYRSIARYHSATPGIGDRYAQKVVRAMSREGLVSYNADGSLKMPDSLKENPKKSR